MVRRRSVRPKSRHSEAAWIQNGRRSFIMLRVIGNKYKLFLILSIHSVFYFRAQNIFLDVFASIPWIGNEKEIPLFIQIEQILTLYTIECTSRL